MKKLFMLSLLVTLTACGGGSGDGGGDFTSGGSASKLVGVWDATTDKGVNGVDESYFVIDSEGVVSSYNYAGDTYDDVGNCYWIEEGVDQLVALGDDRYRSGLVNDFEVLRITISGNTMTLIDTANNRYAYVRSSRKVSSFTPECSDSFADVRKLIPEKTVKSVVNPLLGK